jgi:CheY-like chemotaxis protein
MEHHHSSKQPDWNVQSKSINLTTNATSRGKLRTYPAMAYVNCESVFSSDDENEDNIIFLSESDDEDTANKAILPWKILIADDDSNVHDTTVLALSGVEIHGKPLEFLHAFSAREAQQVAENHPDTSLILLDVVMETVDAGLKLVNVLRDDLSRKNLRIVLRTGQPGYARENLMGNYAIDGYATKSKLTRSILINMLNEVLDSKIDKDNLPN